MTHILITACGDYRHPFDDHLVAALVESIRSHMAAYGVERVDVTFEAPPAIPLKVEFPVPSPDRSGGAHA